MPFQLFGLCRYESVTLPANRDQDLGEIEGSLHYSNATTIMDFQQTSYFAMVLVLNFWLLYNLVTDNVPP